MIGGKGRIGSAAYCGLTAILTAAVSLGVVSCDWGTKSCAPEGALNCVSINDSAYIDPKYRVFMSYNGKIEALSDPSFPGCFIPRMGSVTFFVMEGDSLVAQIHVVGRRGDGCGADFPRVNFDIPG